MAALWVFLRVAHVDVGGIEGTGSLQVEAVPPALVIRDCHGTPLFWHRTSIARRRTKGEFRLAQKVHPGPNPARENGHRSGSCYHCPADERQSSMRPLDFIQDFACTNPRRFDIAL